MLITNILSYTNIQNNYYIIISMLQIIIMQLFICFLAFRFIVVVKDELDKFVN